MSRTTAAGRVALIAALAAFAFGFHAPAANAFTVYKVTNTNDSGDGSLRRAINDAKKDPGLDAIFFKIPGPGLHVIQPLTDLPNVHDHIAGDSQPGYAGTPLIELDGSNDADSFPAGLAVERGTIAGLDIVNFEDGIRVLGPATVIDNVIGADPSGTQAMANSRDGVLAFGDGMAIGTAGHGNLISGNGFVGIEFDDATNATIAGNLVGTAGSGSQALPNAGGGILIWCDSHDDVVGGAGGARNVISGNADTGVSVLGSDCGQPARTTLEGNFIGTDAGGTFAVPNTKEGVFVADASATHIGTWPSTGNVIAGNLDSGIEIGAQNPGTSGATVDSNLIGVNASGGEVVPNGGPGVLVVHADSVRIGQRVTQDHQGDPNVISGNEGAGLLIWDSSSTNVFGNLVGVGSNGTIPAGNQLSGVWVRGGSDVHVGGGIAGQGNVISTNAGDGVVVQGDDAAGIPANRVSIQANWIGTDTTGGVSLANGGSGISILPNADGTRIGNVVGTEGPNIIEDNSRDGVTVNGSVGVRIRGNRISDNFQLGIALSSGGNHAQAAPALSNVKLANGQLTIKGTLQSHPSQDFAIELFANAVCDPSGAGEGLRFLGNDKLTTDASGFGSFTFKAPFNGASAPVITATATRSKTGDTSQFSVCK